MRVIARWLDRTSADQIIGFFIFVVVAAILAVLAFVVPADSEWKAKCRAAGGFDASSEHKYLCIQKSAVIEIK